MHNHDSHISQAFSRQSVEIQKDPFLLLLRVTDELRTLRQSMAMQ
jgi:hypothetical protein